VLETLRTFADRSGTGRTSDRAQSVALGEALAEVYRAAGYPLTLVPELAGPADRVTFVLADLGLA
jgi:hypothetical protein